MATNVLISRDYFHRLVTYLDDQTVERRRKRRGLESDTVSRAIHRYFPGASN